MTQQVGARVLAVANKWRSQLAAGRTDKLLSAKKCKGRPTGATNERRSSRQQGATGCHRAQILLISRPASAHL